jgi:hypothetical protein
VVNAKPRPFTPGKDPFYRRLVKPQGRSGRVRKISLAPGFDPQTVQPVASRYTDWAIPALNSLVQIKYVIILCLEDNIKVDIQELGGGCVDWMELAQDRDRWRALVSAVMNFRVP